MNFEKFHDALDTLIALNHEARAEHAQVLDMYSPPQWAKEFCVVACDIGRRTGKSEYIRRRAKAGDLVVTMNLAARTAMFRDVKCEVLTAQQLERETKARKFNTIFVDEPAVILDAAGRDKFFGLFVLNGEQTFVMLGANAKLTGVPPTDATKEQ